MGYSNEHEFNRMDQEFCAAEDRIADREERSSEQVGVRDQKHTPGPWNTSDIPMEEEQFPTCQDCGFVFYDEETQGIIRQVKYQQDICKRILGYIPGWDEAVKRGLV